ncbi:universal stress protein [Streptosporangium sp. NPDC004379]|uniref:universal stress protein n=1 Tax=Streptosporangium sp. NPDC004379 TaxID=3366189 RepID=UPI0036AF2526
MTQPVIAGADGSAPSLRAVMWAAQEAALRKAPLLIAHTALRWTNDVPLAPQPHHWGAAAEATAWELLSQAAERAQTGTDVHTVTTDILDGPAAEALADAARHAQLLTVGTRGRGGFAGLLLGSVSRDLATRCPCPLIVVGPPPPCQSTHIVVGATGEPGQEPVLRFAFEEARLRGRPLHAVHAWTHPHATPGRPQPLVYDIDAVGQEETLLLAEALAGWREEFPDVTLTEETLHTHPAKALIDASHNAELVVAGATARRTATLGPTTSILLHHSHAPIAVIRHPPA